MSNCKLKCEFYDLIMLRIQAESNFVVIFPSIKIDSTVSEKVLEAFMNPKQNGIQHKRNIALEFGPP
jgi:hypothetical protein